MESKGDGEYRSLGRHISHLSMEIRRYLQRELDPYGIGPGQFHFLICLYHRDGISQEELTDLLMVDKATTTRAVSRLEKSGYITRDRDETDKRRYRVRLTEKAFDLRPTLKQILRNWTSGMLEGFDENEIGVLFEFLERLERNAEDL